MDKSIKKILIGIVDSTANTTTTTQVAARATATTQVADDEKGSFYS